MERFALWSNFMQPELFPLDFCHSAVLLSPNHRMIILYNISKKKKNFPTNIV